ncbi:pyridoxal-phosphate-dependent aminotransferase family protein [Cohnella silvisoli]|uniref:Alanine--glyoxylate aminotransferase family protein n=1 Tax=Cohnella silvisoli TaxID=2873699 RepID=A0ABV1L0Q0_9BACL|nr:alanine--glyoxylate aminotransferase family protein [Cohnella silvisoli]
MKKYADLSPSPRIIMTPGPVEVDPRVSRALSYPMLGQFDPEFTSLMNETMEMLRDLFRTANRWAFPVDGTSRSGIEAVLTGLIEPGERVLVPIYGRFGYLLAEIAERCGAEVVTIEKEWGSVFSTEEVIAAIDREKPSIVAIVHGETSTGRLQPLAEIGHACRERDLLLVVDAVATIGGLPVETDEWKLDAVIGGTQKCLSVPSGMSPLTYNERVEARLLKRKRIERGIRPEGYSDSGEVSFIRSNYLDLAQLQDYWSPLRLNHHTEATAMLYGLREGLRLALEEGLEERFARHRLNERALMAGLEAMGLNLYGDPACKMTVVTCVAIPNGVDGEAVRSQLLADFGIEIASSFGPLKGRIWRIGTMGYSCRKSNVLLTLAALEAVLPLRGYHPVAGRSVQAALAVYREGAGQDE